MATVLIIEADTTLRNAMQSILEIAGHQALSAVDGRCGIEAARAHAPALILCDTSIAGLSALDVLKKLRHDPATAPIPVILVTAHLAKADMRRGLALGATAFLIKPFTEIELLQTITNAIQTP